MIKLEHEYDKVNIDLPELNISTSFEIQEDDQSGDMSTGMSSPGGIKPWSISVSALVPDDKISMLQTILRAARKINDQLATVEWLITHKDLNDLGIRKVKFTGQINIKKADNLDAKSLSFSLKEVASIPERNEAKALGPRVKVDGEKIDPQVSAGEIVGKISQSLYNPYNVKLV